MLVPEILRLLPLIPDLITGLDRHLGSLPRKIRPRIFIFDVGFRRGWLDLIIILTLRLNRIRGPLQGERVEIVVLHR